MIDHIAEKYIKEASLARIWSHIEGGRPFGMITAFRGSYTKRDNLSRNKQMESAIRAAGLGFFRMEGHYVENYGKENAQDVQEQSFFVIGNKGEEDTFKLFLKTLGTKYDQDSVFYFDPKTAKGYLIGTNSTGYPGKNKEISVGKWHPSKAGEFYSKMKNSKFVFEDIQTPPTILSLVNDSTLRSNWWTHLKEEN
jgi:hypothetical protein